MTDNNEVAKGLLWFFAGATLGASLAILYAPASGKATRRLIRIKAEKGSHVLADSGRELMGKGRDLYEKGRSMAEEASDLFERGRKVVEEG